MDWSKYEDVEQIEQDDGPDPVCPIAYTENFRTAMNYFRGIIQKDERSERALHLTKHIIDINAANYTAW